MYPSRSLIAAALMLLALTPVIADEVSDARQAFDRVVVAINERSFEPVKAAIDKEALSKRVYAVRPSEPGSRQMLESQYWVMVEHFFWAGMPAATRNHKLQTVHFRFANGTGFAVLRLRRPGYAFAYTRVDLKNDSRGRLRIIDVQPFNARPSMSIELADYLATFQPTRASTRSLMKANDLSDTEVFQVSELLKAYRDSDNARFYKIFDGLDQRLQDEELLSRLNLLLAMYKEDMARLAAFMMRYIQIQEDKNRFSLALADTHVIFGDLEKAYQALLQFQQNYNLDEGAIPGKLSALALALGDLEAAESHALEAIEREPTLELGWWSLLRARTAAENYATAIEALSRLEADFGHKLNATKLKRDQYHAFTDLVESLEFKEWRAGRE